MTAALFNNQGGNFANVVDGYVYPQFIGYAMRAPTIHDIYPAGTRWQNNAVNPAVIYETTGSGLWYSIVGGGEALTSLTVTPGPTNITGTTNINTSGTGVTSIGTGGTGAVNIGNTTGNTAITGTLTTSAGITATNGNLSLGTAGNKLVIATGANASIGTSAAMTAGVVTVANTSVTAGSIIFAVPAALGTVTAAQAYYISAKVAGTSFTITSASATDTSTWNYLIIN